MIILLNLLLDNVLEGAGWGGGTVVLPYAKVGVRVSKIWIKPQQETNLGDSFSYFDNLLVPNKVVHFLIFFLPVCDTGLCFFLEKIT